MNTDQKYTFSLDVIKKLEHLFFHDSVFPYYNKVENNILNSFINVVKDSVNSVNNFNFEMKYSIKKNIKQLIADYCNILDCSLLIINQFRLSLELTSTEIFKSYYKYNNWKEDYNKLFKIQIQDKKVREIFDTRYRDKDYFEYIRCLLLAHPMDCSNHICDRMIIEDNGIDKSEKHYLVSYDYAEIAGDYCIGIKVLSTTREYIPIFWIKIKDIHDYVNYYYSFLNNVIKKCEEEKKKIESKWLMIKCDENLDSRNSLKQLIDLCSQSNFIAYISELKSLEALINYAYKKNNELSKKYIEIVDNNFIHIKKAFNNHNGDELMKSINFLINPDFDELERYHYCNCIAKTEPYDYSLDYLAKKLGIVGYVKQEKNIDDKISLVIIKKIVDQIEWLCKDEISKVFEEVEV